MAWFKVDDKFHSHPKVIGVSLRAIGLWTKAGSWASDQLTDGFVPAQMITILGGNSGDAKQLVQAGLWSAVEGGYSFHDWTDRNPTRKDVEERREWERERKAEAREAKKKEREREAAERALRAI